jgi:hypothetical protein
MGASPKNDGNQIHGHAPNPRDGAHALQWANKVPALPTATLAPCREALRLHNIRKEGNDYPAVGFRFNRTQRAACLFTLGPFLVLPAIGFTPSHQIQKCDQWQTSRKPALNAPQQGLGSVTPPVTTLLACACWRAELGHARSGGVPD